MHRLALTALTLVLVSAPAAAYAATTTVTFDSQAAGAPSGFDGHVNSPLAIGIATFTGGELLNNEGSSVDLTGVYATSNAVSGPYSNPLGIAFSSGVSAFSLLLTNNVPGIFTVSDNLGASQTFSLAVNSEQTFSLAGTGITSVSVAQAGGGFFDYAIDNVSFNAATAVTPEPSSFALLGTGILGVAGVLRRRLA